MFLLIQIERDTEVEFENFIAGIITKALDQTMLGLNQIYNLPVNMTFEHKCIKDGVCTTEYEIVLNEAGREADEQVKRIIKERKDDTRN